MHPKEFLSNFITKSMKLEHFLFEGGDKRPFPREIHKIPRRTLYSIFWVIAPGHHLLDGVVDDPVHLVVVKFV